MRPTSERQRRRNNALALLLIVCCISAAPKGICDNRMNNNIRDVRQIRDLTSQSNPSGGDDFEGLDDILTAALTESDDENVNLKAEPMENQTLTSGDRATLRCRVKGIGSSNMVYTWYKNRVALRDDERIKMRNRTWGSRLVISDVYTSDSGLYQCEASNGLRRVKTQAFLLVTFHKLPEGQGPKIIHSMYQGKCEKYSGFACKEFFSRGTVYVDTFQVQQTLEDMITQALTAIANQPRIPQKCQIYAKEAFCYFLFPPCVHDRFDRPLKPATPLRLCREDCELLKYDVCGNAFYPQDHDDSPFSVIAQIKNTADCSKLPPTTSLRSNCTKIGLPSVVNGKHKCYNKTGVDYRGTLSVTAGSEICAPWPQKMLLAHPELSGGHNFCRNPGGSRDEPWCYVDREHTTAESCQVPICNFHKDDTPDLIMILIPAVSVPLLLGCLVVVFCVACRKKKKGEQHTKGSPMESKQLSVKKTKVPELSSNVVHVIGELGDGKFGKVFKAQVLSNLHFCPSDPVAVKTLNVGAPPNQVQEFQREMETFSELQHPNVSSLKAVVVQPSLRCMIFEYTSSVDLHEYLVLHSPQADFAKPPSSASSHASTNIDHSDFIRMAIQIAAGMEYLSSHNFIHRDLATRNILVTGNMELKISNLGVVRDSYLSCYYRSPQGGQMLPIRWMAPESLQNWKFSDKSAVWSFGVLLWETFSYGLQPYCGYSNHEVLDMISRRQLLTCPDQCPAKIYSLMHECWSSATSNRPQFKDIHAKLVAWEGTNTTRMTSQLAQGIHRQLNSLQQGPQQYPAHQGTMIDHPPVHDDMHRLHPQYNVSPNAGFLHPSPPGAPHTSPASRLYHSPGATTNSSAPSSHNANVYQQQHPGGYAPHNLPPPPHQDMRVYHPQQHHFHPGSHHSGTHSRSSESAASSEYNQHPPVRVPQLASHPEEVDPPPYGYLQQGRTSRPTLGSHRSQDQVDGSGRNYSNDGTMEMNEEQQLIVKQARPNSGMRGDGRMPLAIYKGEGESEEPSSPGGRVRPTLAPKPNYYNEDPENPDSRLLRRPGVPGVNRDRGMSPSRLSEEQRSRNASSGGKAISCDSGLPCEEQDFDSEGADSHRPLISPTNSTSPSRPEIKSSPLAT